jgi:hypothetical protein
MRDLEVRKALIGLDPVIRHYEWAGHLEGVIGIGNPPESKKKKRAIPRHL